MSIDEGADMPTRRAYLQGWADGEKHGRKMGRAVERAKWRRLVRKRGEVVAIRMLMGEIK